MFSKLFFCFCWFAAKMCLYYRTATLIQVSASVLSLPQQICFSSDGPQPALLQAVITKLTKLCLLLGNFIILLS